MKVEPLLTSPLMGTNHQQGASPAWWRAQLEEVLRGWSGAQSRALTRRQQREKRKRRCQRKPRRRERDLQVSRWPWRWCWDRAPLSVCCCGRDPPHPHQDQANTHRVVQSPRTDDNFQTFDLEGTIDRLRRLFFACPPPSFPARPTFLLLPDDIEHAAGGVAG